MKVAPKSIITLPDSLKPEVSAENYSCVRISLWGERCVTFQEDYKMATPLDFCSMSRAVNWYMCRTCELDFALDLSFFTQSP